MSVVKRDIYCKIFDIEEFYNFYDCLFLSMYGDNADKFIDDCFPDDLSKTKKKEIKADFNKIKNPKNKLRLKNLEHFYKIITIYINGDECMSGLNYALNSYEKELENNEMTEGFYLQMCKFNKYLYEYAENFKGDCIDNISVKYFGDEIMVSFLPIPNKDVDDDEENE